MPRDPRSFDSSGDAPGGREEREPGRRRFIRPPRLCQFCAERVKTIDHKQAEMLKRMVTEQGRIRSRRQTGTCARHQRILARAIKRARHLALLPFTGARGR